MRSSYSFLPVPTVPVTAITVEFPQPIGRCKTCEPNSFNTRSPVYRLYTLLLIVYFTQLVNQTHINPTQVWLSNPTLSVDCFDKYIGTSSSYPKDILSRTNSPISSSTSFLLLFDYLWDHLQYVYHSHPRSTNLWLSRKSYHWYDDLSFIWNPISLIFKDLIHLISLLMSWIAVGLAGYRGGLDHFQGWIESLNASIHLSIMISDLRTYLQVSSELVFHPVLRLVSMKLLNWGMVTSLNTSARVSLPYLELFSHLKSHMTFALTPPPLCLPNQRCLQGGQQRQSDHCSTVDQGWYQRHRSKGSGRLPAQARRYRQQGKARCQCYLGCQYCCCQSWCSREGMSWLFEAPPPSLSLNERI